MNRKINGNNVYIGTDARILGDVTIEDNVMIGANAVVTKSITESGITVAGILARKLVMWVQNYIFRMKKAWTGMIKSCFFVIKYLL